MSHFLICFLGGARYSQPLDSTSEKKFRALKALGELYIIGFSHNIRPRLFSEYAHFYLLPKLPLPVLRYAEIFLFGPILALWLILRHRVQVLVAQSPYEGFAAALAKMLARILGKQVVLIVESHGDFEEVLFLQRRVFLPGIYRLLMRNVARFALNHADLLRTISNSTRKQLEQWAPNKPIFQFAAWTDLEAFSQVSAEKGEHSSVEILYAGVLTPLKGIHYLVSAFARISQDFPQVRLVIVGRDENKAYAVELKALVQRLNLNERVCFVGEVPQVELATWMSKAYVLVIPSLSEGFGRVIIEAMATGTPVIGSHIGGIPEIIEDGITGFLVPPGDEEALAARLRWMLEHPQKARKMGSCTHQFAENLFSTKSYVQGYREIFEAARVFHNAQ